MFTVVPPWYFSSCFPLAFLEGHCSSLFLVATSLHLNPTTLDSLAPSNKVAFSSSTLSQSRWRYSIVLLFLSSSSTTLCLSASSQAFSFASLLAFWAACSAWHDFATSSSWARSYCSSLCLCYIFCCYFSRISVSFWEISEGMEKYMTVQEQEKKLLFHLYIVDLGTIMGFLDKPNRTLNKLNRTLKTQS